MPSVRDSGESLTQSTYRCLFSATRAFSFDEDVAGIAILGVGMNVHVAALAVANTQETEGCRMGQLGRSTAALQGKPSWFGSE